MVGLHGPGLFSGTKADRSYGSHVVGHSNSTVQPEILRVMLFKTVILGLLASVGQALSVNNDAASLQRRASSADRLVFCHFMVCYSIFYA